MFRSLGLEAWSVTGIWREFAKTKKKQTNGSKNPNSAIVYVFSDTQGRRVKPVKRRTQQKSSFDRTKDLNPHFRITRAAPYRALSLSQADSTFNLTKVRAFKSSDIT